jgi:deazaflavin-dependent oxidoreductase (nitroreductase family)
MSEQPAVPVPDDDNKQQPVIDEFRANDGKVGGPMAGVSLLLLNTLGAKTARRRTTPLTCLPEADRYIVVAAAAGNPKHPAWYHNLVAHPGAVTVEVGAREIPVTVRVLTGPEREAAYRLFADSAPQVLAYQAKTTREFPVIAFEPSA